MKLDINTLVRQVASERDIEPEKLIDAVAEAISSAARKHYKERNVHTEIDAETGEALSADGGSTVVSVPARDFRMIIWRRR